MTQGSWSGSGGLRKVVAVAGKAKKRKTQKKGSEYTINSGFKVKK